MTQPIDRDDAGMFQPPGDLGLDQEASPARRVVGVVVEDLLEGDLAVQLAVEGHIDGAEAALGVRPEDAEPLALEGRRADDLAGRLVRVIHLGGRPDQRHGHGQVGITQGFELLSSRGAGCEGGEGFFRVAAVKLEMLIGHRDEERPTLLVDCPAIDEDLGQGPALGPGPRREGGDQLVLVDQAILQREQPEK